MPTCGLGDHCSVVGIAIQMQPATFYHHSVTVKKFLFWIFLRFLKHITIGAFVVFANLARFSSLSITSKGKFIKEADTRDDYLII